VVVAHERTVSGAYAHGLSTHADIPRHDRHYLLGPAKRNTVLELWEVERYGSDTFGDPDYVSIYGLRPPEWYARGVRLLARTTVECTRDRLAKLIGHDVSEVARAASASRAVVIDAFAGSANTLYWLSRLVNASQAIGFELDDAVFETTRRNLAILGLDVMLSHEPYETALPRTHVSGDELPIVFIAPPWGDALDSSHGLDLRRTTPPVPDVVEHVRAAFPGRAAIAAVQVYENVEAGSVGEVESHFEWTKRTTYEIDAPGRNHGVLVGTIGWRPP
jgi:16S rRNA G966 N2-methylase RsmD